MSEQPIRMMLLTTGLGIGGAEVVVRDLAREIDRTQFEVSIGCLKALGPIGRELAAEGIDITVLSTAGTERADYLTGLRLRQLVRKKRIQVLHTHTTHALTDAALCRCFTPGLKVVHTFHFGNYPHKPRRALRLERFGSRFASRLIAVGRVQRDQIQAVHHLDEDDIGVVLNGVALPKPDSGDPEFRERIGVGSGILIGTIATVIPQKGLFDLLAVARRVRDIRNDVRFVVVGEGELRPELERKRHELGLDDTVVFTGWMSNAAALALPAFDIYFQPSLWEAMSISILEAMAAGKPVVCTRVGEAPHVIEPGTDGLLLEAGDVAGMAGALLSLADQPDRRRAIGQAASAKVAGAFTVSHMARAYEQVYRDVLRVGRLESHVA